MVYNIATLFLLLLLLLLLLMEAKLAVVVVDVVASRYRCEYPAARTDKRWQIEVGIGRDDPKFVCRWRQNADVPRRSRR